MSGGKTAPKHARARLEGDRLDLLATVEAIYRVDQGTSSWLLGILETLSPWLEYGLGAFGFTYAFDSHLRMSTSEVVRHGCPGDLAREVLPAAELNDFVSNSYVTTGIGVSSTIAEWRGARAALTTRSFGILDAWGIVGPNWDRHGVAVIVNRGRSQAIPRNTTQPLTRVAAHLSAAIRLRRRLDAGAIDDPSVGAVMDSEVALASWTSSVGARWVPVERFEAEGKRHVLGREYAARVPELANLTFREQEVLASLALGRTNKEIAYELGLADSTVRVLMARAAKRLGVRDRAALERRLNALAVSPHDD